MRSLEVLVDIQVSPQALPHPPRSHQRSFPSLPETKMQLSTKHFLIMHFDRFVSHPSQSDFFSSQNSSRACFADLVASNHPANLFFATKMALAKLGFVYHPNFSQGAHKLASHCRHHFHQPSLRFLFVPSRG